MDELALALDLDPIALRRRNYATIDQQKDLPYTLPEALEACYQRVSEGSGWHERSSRSASTDRRCGRPRRVAPTAQGCPDKLEMPIGMPAGMTEGSRRRGIGFAAHDWMGGSGHPPGYAWIELNSDGSADVVTGTQDIGTGTRTGLAQVAAEELGLPIDRIAFHLGDTGPRSLCPGLLRQRHPGHDRPGDPRRGEPGQGDPAGPRVQLLEIPSTGSMCGTGRCGWMAMRRSGMAGGRGDGAGGAATRIHVQGARSPNPEPTSRCGPSARRSSRSRWTSRPVRSRCCRSSPPTTSAGSSIRRRPTAR